MKFIILSILTAALLCTPFARPTEQDIAKGPICFRTSDSLLQKLYDSAVEKAKWNIDQFGKYKVLVEGAGYNNVWLETQPMGGYMYGKRDPDIAKNNIEIFIDYQRNDGRLPGMITNENGYLTAHYGWFQGLFLAAPAFETWFILNKDKSYIYKVYAALKKFDDYLWQTRDSDGDGCLETWCLCDTGEDASIRLGKTPVWWPYDYPPIWDSIKSIAKNKLNEVTDGIFQDSISKYLMPIESMDIMSYSYTCRDILAKISKETNNGMEKYWREKAESTRKTLKKHLWNSGKHACYDKDNNDHEINILIHNNLRCMYFGSFDQQMADDFIRYHLMNCKEFWTPFPLPSIAANDKMFRNESGNNWSGQPEGLTYQRSIRALENYGHYAELTLLGKSFLNNLEKYDQFKQQYDPFTGLPNSSPDGYGPSILATLEFITRIYGIHITEDTVLWSCLNSTEKYQYTQQYLNSNYRMETNGNMVECYVNGQKILSFTKGIRVITDLKGQLIGVEGIETDYKKAEIIYCKKTFTADVYPNTFFSFNGKLKKSKCVPFYEPY
jgi:hypothetical protein